MKQRKISHTLARLSCAALALPGLMPTATAGRVEETYNADFQYGHYAESNQRMQVDIFEGALSAPIGKSMTASVNLVRDMVSGASPIYNYKDEQGRIQQVISGASPSSSCGESICEQRDAVSSGLTYFLDSAAINAGGGFSREHDYTSRYFNTNMSLDLNKKLTTLNFGASVAFDEIAPSPSAWNSRDMNFKSHKTSQQYLLGVAQVIDKDSLVQSNMTFGYQSGFLSDPYKWVAFYDGNNFSDFQQDKRPQQKFQWAWLNQYVRHFGALNNAALHLDYRFTTDDWGVNSHTFEASWHQPIVDNWQIIPRFRYYSQDKADFYQPVFDGNSANYAAYSSDYRLAGFGAFSGGLKLSKEITQIKPFSQLKFQTGFEYYNHKAGYELGGNNRGNFDSFSYTMVTASFNLKF
ncbi:DUF3570 domain-containing protein [Candidatus Methylobacter oryzae]|uniref:DUF3570 domain-containing protein n=1 Tax=Candidatus Methylobacter oryzae TaxID=2497749 RepID=A0ABY3CIF5_9GAMM|nr:DUF3570 domain-containing protein [Candidatus Methylobacter oryzae]TRX03263.1 DUF3570 domain-containing protein [Candidatus Methylobacter oryzae]